MFSKLTDIAVSAIASSIPSNKNFDYKKVSGDNKRTLDLIGVKNSYAVDKETTTLDLCLDAAKLLIKKMKVKTIDIEILIVVTQTPDYLMPSCSNIVHKNLNLSQNCLCFDINQGCSGYVYGLHNIISIMKINKLKKGLLLVGDTISKTIRKDDMSHKMLFGDAGTTTLLEYNKGEKIFFQLGSDGNGHNKLMLKESAFKNNTKYKPEFYMDGKEVFLFAISSVPKLIKNLIKSSKKKFFDIHYFVFHQANKFMLSKIFDFLNIEEKKRLFSIEKYGNTSSASIPLTLCKFSSKLSSKNKNILIAGFGAGFSYAAAILNLSNTKIFRIKNYEKK